jgi:hypothetical protein
MNHGKGNRLSSGVFLLGLGLLFMSGWWWPGILFVIGASSLAQTVESGRRWQAAQGTLWMFGLGLLFTFGFNLGLLLLIAGASMIGGHLLRGGGGAAEHEKRKRKLKNEDFDDEPDIAYRIGDDGELIPEEEFYKEERARRRAD